MEKQIEIERSIIKKYRQTIWARFVGGIKDYALLQEGDKIAVCVSGGKDSFLLAKCMQQLQKYTDRPFSLTFLCMDPGYRPENRALIAQNAEKMGIPLQFFETDIFDFVANKADGSPCYLCARMRRGYLYKHAKALGCNKIALGHHFDDVAETVLMSMLYGGELKSMMPKLHSENYDGMELIRPLYLVHEADILAWKRYNDLSFLQCACRFTEAAAAQEAPHGARARVKALLKELQAENPQAAANIFAATHSVHLGTMPGTVENGVRHSFLEHYADETP